MTPASEKSIRVTIDGRPLTVAPGTTILEAARSNSIDIPTLCNHPLLRPEGVCRLCLVEVEGMRALQTSCTLPVSEGMVVKTDTPEIRELRKETLSLTLSEHPYSCLICDRHSRCGEWQTTIRKAAVTTGCENCPKNGQCELQALVEKVGLNSVPYPIAYRNLPVEKSDPFFDRDYNLCVLCGRCVRACQEERLSNILGFLRRGSSTRVGAAAGYSHLELDCEFCGSCVDVCPTGALFDKRTKWEGPYDTTATTICPYCAVGCRLELRLKRGRIIGVRPDADGPANRGQACVRGRFGLVELAHAENRLTAPRLRRDGRLVEADWDAALADTAERLLGYRGEAFALIGSPHLTNEAAHLAQKFAREVMHSSNVDSCGLLPAHARAEETRRRMLDLPRATLDTIAKAGTILVIGSNPRQSHPVAAVRIRQAMRWNGAKLIVIDPRETELARRADVWLRPPVGGDTPLLKQLAAKRPAGDESLLRAARLLREHAPAVILFGSGVMDQPEAPETIDAIRALAKSLGDQTVILPLPGASNAMGVSASGLAAAGQDAGWAKIAAGIEAGTIKALYVAGELPPLPALTKLELLIHQDVVSSPHLENIAHAVFPAAGFAEMSGTLTNLEGREQTFQAALPPAGSSRPDWMIFAGLAQAMGATGFDFADSSAVHAELAKEHAGRTAPAEKTKARKSPALAPGEIWLITERNAFAYRSFALTKAIRGMAQVKSDEDVLKIHPLDASALGIVDGDRVQVTSAHGSDVFVAHVSPREFKGSAFASVNPLTGSPVFPARTPSDKQIAVRLRKMEDGHGTGS